MSRILVWFSAGAASAVAAKLASDKYGDNCEVLYCNTLVTEHPDNYRFIEDISKWINKPIKILSSTKYTTVDDVFMGVRYMSGPKGARCTVEMKKIPREQYQQETDIHIFGYTYDEERRCKRFEDNNPALNVEWILVDEKITKEMCYGWLRSAGIKLPAMYALGYDHNNCLGCVKASSPRYWNMIRRDFPEVFQRRAEQCRLLGVRLVIQKGRRLFLDELPTDDMSGQDKDIECGPVCQTPTSN